MTRDALISIRPHFAEAIIGGDKTVELRRRVPSMAPDTRLWVYATLPLGAVLGSVVLKAVVHGSPDEIWSQYSEFVGLDRCEFDAYYAGTDKAVALILSEPCRRRPISLARIRQMKTGFQPPQVLAHLTAQESKSFARIAGAPS